MSFSFSALNLKGIEALFSDVSRCTMSDSLLHGLVVEKALYVCGLEMLRTFRAMVCNLNGESFDAMVDNGKKVELGQRRVYGDGDVQDLSLGHWPLISQQITERRLGFDNCLTNCTPKSMRAQLLNGERYKKTLCSLFSS